MSPSAFRTPTEGRPVHVPSVVPSRSEMMARFGHNQQARRMEREREAGAAHAHHHGLDQTPEGRIRAALILTLLTMAASIAGGLFAHSLALLSDAGHMLADAGALP